MKKLCLILAAGLCLTLLFGSVAYCDDSPSFDTKLYGYIKLDGSVDQNLTSHGNFVMWIDPVDDNTDDQQFNMTANQSRFGCAFKGKNIPEVDIDGRIEFDLYGGVSGATVAQNDALLQLRHAYFAVQRENTQLLAGQTWDLIAPLNPPTLNYTELWGCGNIGYRRAQLRLSQSFPAGENTWFTFAGGAFRTIGDDLTTTFTLAAEETTDGLDDGTDAGIPSVQGRWELQHTFSEGGHLQAGISGLYGWLNHETNLGDYEYESWAVVGHFEVNFPASFGFSGEVFTGSNLGNYYGGILQNSTIDGVSANGGWTSVWVHPSSQVRFAAGFGIDDPDDNEIYRGRSQNSCIFGNVTWSFVSQAQVGIEISNWETKYKDDSSAKNLRAQSSFTLHY